MYIYKYICIYIYIYILINIDQTNDCEITSVGLSTCTYVSLDKILGLFYRISSLLQNTVSFTGLFTYTYVSLDKILGLFYRISSLLQGSLHVHTSLLRDVYMYIRFF